MFGNKDNFTGLGVFVDTYPNEEKHLEVRLSKTAYFTCEAKKTNNKLPNSRGQVQAVQEMLLQHFEKGVSCFLLFFVPPFCNRLRRNDTLLAHR